jgi:two-component system NtrC family sensor kinase
VCEAQSFSPEAYEWDVMDLIMLIGGQAGSAIANARLRDEERTHQAHQKTLATALEIMQQPVFILSRDADIRYANTAAVEEYQYSVEEFLGMKCWELRVLPRVRPGEIEEIYETLEESGTWSVERLHRRKDGTEFPALVTLSAIRDAKGLRVGEVECVRNLTEERRVAEQLRHSERLVALGELVAGVAHEINNPLTGMSSLSQMLVEDSITAEQ